MSLVFENAIAAFDPDAASLFEPPEAALSGDTDDRVPLEAITEYATHHDRLQHPEREDWACIPLHDPEGPRLTGEYVAYTHHSVRGDLLVYREGDSRGTIDLDAAARTPLAARLRYWHSDYVPETDPPYYISPIQASEPARNPVADRPPEAFFADLLGFVEGERSARRTARRERAQRRSPETIHRDGDGAVPNLHSLGQASGSVYRFRLAEKEGDSSEDGARARAASIPEEYGVHEGNEVLLFAPGGTDASGAASTSGNAPDAFPLSATITDLTGSNLYVEVSWEGVDRRTAVQRFLDRVQDGYGLVSILNPVPFDRETAAIETVRQNDRFRGLLAGQNDLTFGHSAAALSETHDDDLNQEQQVAVEHALLADDLFCIHGPPGTGKTRTLVEIVRRAAQAGDSVLVCADSNQAIDNLVVGSSTPDEPDERSLHAHAQHVGGEFSLARANSHRSRNPLVQDCYGTRNAGSASVVAATNSTAATIDREFDAAVVDEATQATCTATCIPLSKADKIVLAGDHKQLPPFSSTETPPDSALGLSLFEHLYADGGVYEGVGVQLRTQYRMHDKISYFPNRTFYDRVLRNGPVIESLPDHPAIVGYDIGGTERAVETSLSNPTEARLAAYLAADLASGAASVPPEEIGIITPYRAQVGEIRARLREGTNLGDGPVVDTVDSFQGSEKRAVLLSLVRSNPEGEIGFMGRPTDGPRRLNVALTRSRQFCGVIGNWDTLVASAGEDTEKCAGLYQDLHAHLDDTGRLRNVEPELLPS